MKAVIGGVAVEGTPEEISAFAKVHGGAAGPAVRVPVATPVKKVKRKKKKAKAIGKPHPDADAIARSEKIKAGLRKAKARKAKEALAKANEAAPDTDEE